MECKRCAQCCTRFAVAVGYSDIMRWYKEGRYDILYNIVWHNSIHIGRGYYIESTLNIVHGKTICVFLNENICSIHNTKPRVCSDMPVKDDRFKFCPNWNILENNTQYIYREEHNDIMKAIINKDKIDKIIEEARMKIIEDRYA